MRFTFMLFTLLLAAALADAPPASAAPATATFAEAAELETAGRYDEALAAFQEVVAANPSDHQARLAIARLHMRMGHPDRAESVYQGVRLEDTTNLEAVLGVADARIAQWRSEDALEALERAEELAPEDPRVLQALGRTHQQAGRSTLAVAYMQRAVSLSSAPAYRMSLERARATHQNRLEMRSLAEEFSGATPTTASGDVSVNLHLTDAVRLSGRGQMQRKFDVDDARGGAGVEWRWTPATTIVAQALVGPGNRVLPKGDVLGGVNYTTGPMSVMGSVRYFKFEGAQVTTLSPTLTFWPTERLSFGLGYALSVTDTPMVLTKSIGNTAHLTGSFQVFPRVWLNLGYARGVEDFDDLTIDRIGAFQANTGSAGVRVDLPWLTSLVGSYERQQRQDDTTMQRISIGVSQRF
jgi:YaiO family outer membrane protein